MSDFSDFKKYFFENHAQRFASAALEKFKEELQKHSDENGKIKSVDLSITLSMALAGITVELVMTALEAYHNWKEHG